jgi:hypothetical protein
MRVSVLPRSAKTQHTCTNKNGDQSRRFWAIFQNLTFFQRKKGSKAEVLRAGTALTGQARLPINCPAVNFMQTLYPSFAVPAFLQIATVNGGGG